MINLIGGGSVGGCDQDLEPVKERLASLEEELKTLSSKIEASQLELTNFNDRLDRMEKMLSTKRVLKYSAILSSLTGFVFTALQELIRFLR